MVIVTNWDLVGGVLTDIIETGEKYILGCPWAERVLMPTCGDKAGPALSQPVKWPCRGANEKAKLSDAAYTSL